MRLWPTGKVLAGSWPLSPLAATWRLPDAAYFLSMSLLGFPAWLYSKPLAKTASLITNGNKTYSEQTEGNPTSQLIWNYKEIDGDIISGTYQKSFSSKERPEVVWFLANSSEELLIRTPGFLTPKYHLSHKPCRGPWVRWMGSAKSVISYGVSLTGGSDDLGCHWGPRLDSSPVIHLSQQVMVPVL